MLLTIRLEIFFLIALRFFRAKKYLVFFSLSSAHFTLDLKIHPLTFSYIKCSNSAFSFLYSSKFSTLRLVSSYIIIYSKLIILFLLTWHLFLENFMENFLFYI